MRVAASRGAPYDVPTVPSMRTRVPTAGAVTFEGARTEIAPVPSWTTKSLPLLSRREAGAVTTATMATGRPLVRVAAAIEIGWTAGALPDADAVGLGVGVGAADGVGVGAGVTSTTSAASRRHRR
jgi:hypothetical protein